MWKLFECNYRHSRENSKKFSHLSGGENVLSCDFHDLWSWLLRDISSAFFFTSIFQPRITKKMAIQNIKITQVFTIVLFKNKINVQNIEKLLRTKWIAIIFSNQTSYANLKRRFSAYKWNIIYLLIKQTINHKIIRSSNSFNFLIAIVST